MMESKLPEIGLIICNSGASNSGPLTGLASIEVIKEFANTDIFSLPALANKILRQLGLVKKVPHLIIIDGCKNGCAKKIAESLQISYDAYLNLEYDLGIKKIGPFTTLQYSEADIGKVKNSIRKIILKG